MLKIALIVFVVAVGTLLVYAATRPDTFRIERSTSIGAPPEKVFPHVASVRNWAAWSPWEKMDPDMKRTYGGPESGVGASQSWAGNSKVGEGSMEVVESQPSSRLLLKLDFLKPFEAHNMAEFTFTPEAGGTRVVWSMYGPSNFISKLMSVFMSMDAMVGPQFEQGLADLKRITEK